MITQVIIDYIKAQLEQGVSSEKIKADLMANGWSASDLDQAFSTINIAPGTVSSIPVPPSVSNEISNSGGKSRKLLWALILILIILLIGGGAYAVIFLGINPFSKAPYSQNNLLSGLLQSVSKIKSGTYAVSGSVVVEPRDKKLSPIVINKSNDKELQAKYMRDYDRSSNVRNILNKLVFAKTLPTNLNNISSLDSYSSYKVNINDPLTKKPYEYTLKPDGKDFELRVNFETVDAISEIGGLGQYGLSRQTPLINGQTVTFTRESDSYFYLSSKPPATFLESLNSSIEMIPEGLNVVFSLSASSHWDTADKPMDLSANLDATGDLGDLTYKANVDLRKKDSVYYVKINNFPAFFPVPKNQWIKFDTQAGTSTSYYDSLGKGIAGMENNYKEEKEKILKFVEQATRIADEEGLLKFKNDPIREKVGDRFLYRYDLSIVKEKVAPFYKKLSAWVKAENNEVGSTFVNDLYTKQIENNEFADVLDYLNSHGDFSVWVDDEGYPAVIAYSLHIVPTADNIRLKDKQITSTIKLTFNNINSPVNIELPTEAKTYQEVVDEMYGNSVSDARSSGQIASMKSRVSSIRAQAELVYDKNSGYGTKAFTLGPCTKISGTLFGDEMVYKLLMEATGDSPIKATCASKIIGSSVSEYAISVPYPDGSGYAYCIDNSGIAKEIMGKLDGYSCSEIKY
jgi:hypothetical protein